MKINKAIILAGGKGVRLRPVTLETPKPLITVKRKAILTWLCELFITNDVKSIRVIVNSNDLEEFKWWFERFKRTHENQDYDIDFFVETKPLGTFGFVKTKEAREWLNGESFFLSNGDELKAMNLKDMAKQHLVNREKGGIATIALATVEDPEHYGVPIVESERIIKFLEKPVNPPSNNISSGLYLLDTEFFDYQTDQEFEMIELIWDRVAQDNKLYAFDTGGKWYDTGTFERWEKAINEWPY